ncbi:MAG: folate family ECF transporter S component [Eubacteriales bacterium]|nr:folate family ECF transporter S component [Eubacteriales bacterium]
MTRLFEKRDSDSYVQRITIMAMMIALQIVLSRFFSIRTPFAKISLAFVPLYFVACSYGPLTTVILAFVSDLIGATLFPSGPFFWGFMVTAVVRALIVGTLLYDHKKTSAWLLFTIFAEQLICSTLINSANIAYLQGAALWTVLKLRLVTVVPVNFAAECVLLFILVKGVAPFALRPQTSHSA